MIAIVLVGPPGAGKSTLARGVAAELGLPLISSGDIARHIGSGDKFTQAGLERGDWAPELAMREEVLNRIEEASIKTGDFVIEGFPRRLEQLYIVESVEGIKPLYINLECDVMTCMRRLIARKRNGDHPDAVATRFRSYEEFTVPMIDAIGHWAWHVDGCLPTETLVEAIIDRYQLDKRA